MRKKISAALAAAALFAVMLSFSGCGQDVSIYTNPQLVIGSYTYDDYLDPTRGENRDTFGTLIWSMVRNTKIRLTLTLYTDGTCEMSGNSYNGLQYAINNQTGTYELKYGTLENGVILLHGALYGSIMGMQVGGSEWWIQLINGTQIVSVGAPHGTNTYGQDWLLQPVSLSQKREYTEEEKAVSQAVGASLKAIADEKGEDALKAFVKEEE